MGGSAAGHLLESSFIDAETTRYDIIVISPAVLIWELAITTSVYLIDGTFCGGRMSAR